MSEIDSITQICRECGQHRNQHEVIGTSGYSICPALNADSSIPRSEVEEALNEEFWSFCEDNAINGALRIDENWRVDDVAVKFASHIRQQERERAAKKVSVRYVRSANFPDEPREQYVIFIGETPCLTGTANVPIEELAKRIAAAIRES